jgi:hypothetical protein
MRLVRMIVCLISFGFVFPHAFVEDATTPVAALHPMKREP